MDVKLADQVFKALDECDTAFAVINIGRDHGITPQAAMTIRKAWPKVLRCLAHTKRPDIADMYDEKASIVEQASDDMLITPGLENRVVINKGPIQTARNKARLILKRVQPGEMDVEVHAQLVAILDDLDGALKDAGVEG